MNILNNGLLINPNRLCPETPAWMGHIPFAGWLIEEHKPNIFVELGTHTGVSYSAFCQAIIENRLSTKCYAVDTWQGEEHAGVYSQDIYNEYSTYHQQHFSSFSQLLKMTFDESLHFFSDGSVDLLHIDGLHTYEAVKHDFDTWLPKMSSRGIILFHDINVRERDFGVWKLWEEISTLYPSIEFHHSHGLGVLLVGNNISENILNFQRNSFWAVNKLFPRLGESFTTIAARDNKISTLSQIITTLTDQIKNKDAHITQHLEIISDLQKSFSWRITKPLRYLINKTKRV